MGQVLHGSATTTEAIRRAIQHSQESLRALAKRYGINQKTVAKWQKRASIADLPTGPKEPRSTVLSPEEEAVIVAFRRYTLLPLDDCLYALQPTIPHLTRSSLHRCLQRHGIGRLPDVEGDKPAKKKFKAYPIGYFHIDIAEVRTEQGKLHMFVAIDRTSSSRSSNCTRRPRQRSQPTFCVTFSRQSPTRFTPYSPTTASSSPPAALCRWPHRRIIIHMLRHACEKNDIDHRLTKPKHPWTNGQVETDEPDHQGSDGQALPLRKP